MEAWMWWLIAAGAVVILELMTGTFYLLMVSIGLLAGAAMASLFDSVALQLVVAAVVGAVATTCLHFSRFGLQHKPEVSSNPNVNIDIGQQLDINEWTDAGNGRFVARSKYRGALWDIELQHGHANNGRFEIVQVVGSRLVVRPVL
ncbi:NfeD family protein [Undibacterium cyanobacteriorum]|uniref:NfeD family protein n=1 Tax=Undibacterium cyanobacteriorum TaxID=3073561 RepID=A0ABY9RMH9_9BURK|nr:NfeD family protein [Undibacterium sp. 20NA77.5]WMW82413.1 NfeD family protein [Undibacterium sp. 20NA77.5]